MKDLQVTDLMERDPVAASPEMPLAELVALLSRHHVRALPVTDAEGRLAGVISETDLFLKQKGVPFSLEKVPSLLGEPIAKDHFTEHAPSTDVTVAEVMTEKSVTIGADAPLERAALRMLESRHSVLPVVDGGRLVGMLRRIQLLQAIYG